MQWGLGRMGMSKDEFFSMTFRQFFNKLKGFQELREADILERSKIARLQAAAIVQAWMPKGMIVEPESLWKLKGDPEPPEPTEEGLEEFKKRFGDKV